MKTKTRRILLAVGAALLVGGWGTTRYSHELKEMRTQEATKAIYVAGVAMMTIGAGLIGFGATKPDSRRCAKCGYDLRGSPSGRCPECGA